MSKKPKVGDHKVIARGKNLELSEFLNDVPGKTKFEKFGALRGMGYSKEQICRFLNISKAAFSDCESRTEVIVGDYMRFQAKYGHLMNLKTALQMQWKNCLKLEKRADSISKKLDEDPEDTKLIQSESNVRANLTTGINTLYHLQIHTPLAASFDKFIKENIVEGSQKKVKKGLPVLPEELSN